GILHYRITLGLDVHMVRLGPQAGHRISAKSIDVRANPASGHRSAHPTSAAHPPVLRPAPFWCGDSPGKHVGLLPIGWSARRWANCSPCFPTLIGLLCPQGHSLGRGTSLSFCFSSKPPIASSFAVRT